MGSTADDVAFLASAQRARAAPVLSLSLGPTHLRYPFTLGVASGDPVAGGVVLWTRLAPCPEQPDGGMTAAPALVRWELAQDDHFRSIVSAGAGLARAELAHSVHVDVRDLVPGGVYWYRFWCAGHVSPVGCTRTASATSGHCEGVRFAVASGHDDQPRGYPAYDAIAREDLDFLLFLGDYAPCATADAARARDDDPACDALAELRMRHARQKRDGDLQAAHRALPWIVASRPFQDDAHGRAALQAFWEHLPIRRSRLASFAQAGFPTPHFTLGALADLHVTAPSASVSSAIRTLHPPRSHWSVWVFPEERAGQLDVVPPEAALRAGRSALNTVLLSASVQASAVMLVGSDNARCDGEARGSTPKRRRERSAEGSSLPCFVASSISAPPCAPSDPARAAALLFRDPRRGYLRCDLDRDGFRADFLVLPQSRPGAALAQSASYFVESGSARPAQQ